MTRDTALDILQLPKDAKNDAIDAQFSQLYNNYQVKITNAPTNKLRRTFTENLERLNEAYRVLKQPQQHDRSKFFPTREPSTTVNTQMPPPNPTFDNSRPSLPFSEKEHKNVKKWRSFFLLTSILALTLAGFFLAKWLEGRDAVTEQMKLIAAYETGLQNMPFEIMNSSNETLTITGFKIFYFDAEEKQIKELLYTYEKKARQLVSGDSFKPTIDDQSLDAFAYLIIYKQGGIRICSGVLNIENPLAKLFGDCK